MTVSEIATLIGDLGVMVVICALMIVIFYKMWKKNEERFDEMFKAISRGHHPSDEDTDLLDIVNDKIYHEIRGVLDSLKADRIYVMLYHNGGMSSSGLYFQRMSCICEVVAEGILPVSASFQSVHKGAYSQVCKSLRETGKYFVSDVEELKTSDSFIYQVAKSRHTPSFYFRVLRDTQNNAIGFVGIDYCSYNEQVDENTINHCLKSSALKISSLVDIRSEVTE